MQLKGRWLLSLIDIEGPTFIPWPTNHGCLGGSWRPLMGSDSTSTTQPQHVVISRHPHSPGDKNHRPYAYSCGTSHRLSKIWPAAIAWSAPLPLSISLCVVPRQSSSGVSSRQTAVAAIMRNHLSICRDQSWCTIPCRWTTHTAVHRSP